MHFIIIIIIIINRLPEQSHQWCKEQLLAML